jgi:hypothetical protein
MEGLAMRSTSDLLWEMSLWWARVPSRAGEILAGLRGFRMPQPDESWGWLTEAWAQRVGDAIPLQWHVRSHLTERWVRFHSLPDSQRYADTENEYELLLDRHHQVLAALRGADSSDLVVVHPRCDAEGRFHAATEFRRIAKEWALWRTFDARTFGAEVEDDPDDVYQQYAFVRRLPLAREVLDPLLRRAADDVDCFLFTNESVDWIYAPYDGGADVIARTPSDRDALRERYAEWLSSYPGGL